MDTMNDRGYIPLLIYQGQQVYYDMLGNQVLIERDSKYLSQPLQEERKPLIDAGLVKILNEILKQNLTIPEQ